MSPPALPAPGAPIGQPALPPPGAPIGQPEVPPAGPTPTPANPPTPQPIQPVVLDTANDMVGIAQQITHQKGAQARIMWIDAGANIGNLDSPEKIQSVVDQIKAAGFNMIVVDVKPIVGDTIYPSKFAPKLTEWRGSTSPADLDVLRHVVDDGHAAGLTVYANMSTFGEGHKMVQRGLGYQHPNWQTVMYLTDRSVEHLGSVINIDSIDKLPANDGGVTAIVGNQSLLRKKLDGYTAAILNLDARVEAIVDGSVLDTIPLAVPPGGFALIGKGRAGQWIATHSTVGEIMLLRAQPKFVPIAQDNTGDQAYTIFVNPDNAAVRQHELDIVREIVTNYDVDGLIFDDRMRYAGLNADFGPETRAAFEAYVGHKLAWPDDVYRDNLFPGQPIVQGPYFSQWLTWRANVITSWLTEASRVVRSTRSGTQVAVYVGSWYGDYYKNASNWAAADFDAPYPWETPEYEKTGYAGLLDWLTTGCYYAYPTIDDARSAAKQDPTLSPGESVEAAGQLSNRVVNDSAFTYAGLYALTYQGNPTGFERAIQSATGSSQGVMIFDLSQIIQYNWWANIADAFGSGPVPAAPNMVPGLLDDVRAQHAADVAAGKPRAPIPSYQGVEDVGL